MADKTEKNLDTPFTEIRMEELRDVDELFPDVQQDISDKVGVFIDKSGNQPYTHINQGYVVKIMMTGEVDATDAFSNYLRKKTELFF